MSHLQLQQKNMPYEQGKMSDIWLHVLDRKTELNFLCGEQEIIDKREYALEYQLAQIW